jgi:hypothetical protein
MDPGSGAGMTNNAYTGVWVCQLRINQVVGAEKEK